MFLFFFLLLVKFSFLGLLKFFFIISFIIIIIFVCLFDLELANCKAFGVAGRWPDIGII